MRAQYGDFSGLAQLQTWDPATPLAPPQPQHQPPMHAWQPSGQPPAGHVPSLWTHPSSLESLRRGTTGSLQHASAAGATGASGLRRQIHTPDTSSANPPVAHRPQAAGARLPASAAALVPPQRVPSPGP